MINRKKVESVENTSKYEVKVLNASIIKQDEELVISFNLLVNGITIYNMIYRSGISNKTGEAYELISFPSRKGTNGIYYNHVWFAISKELEASIMDMVIEKINEKEANEANEVDNNEET